MDTQKEGMEITGTRDDHDDDDDDDDDADDGIHALQLNENDRVLKIRQQI